MTEEITREEAKEVIQRIRNCVGAFKPTSFIHFPVYRNTIPALDMAIKSLEQDRPIGHWEHYEPLPSEWSYKCSICGCPERSNGHRYCCNCGAKMETQNIV